MPPPDTPPPDGASTDAPGCTSLTAFPSSSPSRSAHRVPGRARTAPLPIRPADPAAPPTSLRRPRSGRLRIALLVLVGVEAEQLHLDVIGRVELELTGREGRGGILAGRTNGREFDDDALVTLDERIHEQLVGARLELEML